jgi:putative ABC transport system substrate-binding protein
MCGVSRSIEAVSRRHILSCCLWEGQNALIEYRFAEGQYDRLPDLVRELLQLNVDVIVASPTPAVLVAKDAARDTPKRLELKATVGGS